MRIRYFVALAILLCVGSLAYAQKTKTVLDAEITSQFPDNSVGTITPQILRTVTGDFLDSWQQFPAINAQTGVSYTFLASDYGALVTFDNGAAVAAALPTPSGSFGIGFNVYVRNLGAGTVTITPSGATINGAATLDVTTNQSIWIISDGNNYQVWNNSSGTVTSVAMTVPSSIFSIGGSPITSSGTLAVTVSGTSGGIPYFDSATTLNSSALLAANGVIYGGGAGATPASTAAGAAGTVLGGGSPPAFTATPTLGTAGSVVGTLAFANLTSGTVTISPPTGALGSAVVTLPGATSTLAALDLADQTISGGGNVTSLSQATGNITIDCGARPLQYMTNSGAFTITAPANDGSCILLVTNDGTAGSITFSGFSVGGTTGDSLTTTNGDKFSIQIWRINGTSGYRVAAHQ